MVRPEDDDADFTEAAKDALMAAHGFADEWVHGADNTAYFANKKAAEAAIGLAILVVYFRNRGTIQVEDIHMMRG